MNSHVSLARMHFPKDSEDLIRFLTGSSWPFHVANELTPELIRQRIAENYYDGDSRQSYWVTADSARVGYLAIEDLEDLPDGAPMFDLRIAQEFRGNGLAVPTLNALVNLVFETWPVRRLEGQTRHDNLAMRAAFRKAGWVKEAHYRQGWPAGVGVWADSIAYAILRDDWKNGTRTEVDWAE